jgi:hypothetical protein
MAYRVLIDGVAIECDSPDEALEIARRATREGGATEQPTANGGLSSVTGSRWSEARVKEFFRTIKAQQRKLIDALLENADPRTDKQLFQLLGLNDGKALAGVFTALWKNAKKVGADPYDLYTRQVATIGDAKVYEYSVTDSFRKAAKKWKP